MILTHGLHPIFQGGAEFVPDTFHELLSHGTLHLILLPVLVFTLNSFHPGLLLIKQFANQDGH